MRWIVAGRGGCRPRSVSERETSQAPARARLGAIADHLLRDLKEAGHGSARVEGLPQCDWVLIDAGDVIIHVFRPEVRAFYNIEKLWSADLTAPVHYSG